MVSKSQIKLITSLEQKKYRTKNGLFIVEGKKGIQEFLNSTFELETLFTIEDSFNAPASKTLMVKEEELKKISRLHSSQTALALFKIPEETLPELSGLTVALDGVRDPGNLGTIIRLCDWFGVKELLCSGDTVDCYNPKVVQASMGSLTRVKLHYHDLQEVVNNNTQLPVMGTFLEGENVYTATLPASGIIILGNEANGISTTVEELVTQKLTIPQFGAEENTESLNVATATAILLSEFRRQENY
ncbi:RNA methyltransferase [Antarcticibacterium flavum]|uniref:RNA methyltransferase n=1 Tax=Antarcticibacterium flavum TaxID=2058175 RepID=A0A5B7X6F4_9FLAO|nr:MULTISPECIES: RNA methyltransferase [Antarcticibacterium]MCM4158585.1 RNA methyltransferase [Antarcticibacterium sp. W02-3]QCY70328.1 RNA methyltransferase [Antarcticibacterium flavum]